VTGGGTRGPRAAGETDDERIVVGNVDAPGGRIRVEDEERPQSLGGVLPLTIGLDEQGQFDFDQAVLRPEVKTLLDELANKLNEADYDRLDIVGHTDRIGAPDYNQYLSERRAWAVARYLLDKGVPLKKMRVEGMGERHPITTPEECAEQTREELIQCLQKDRRVEIDAAIHKSHVRVEEGG
jgi:outer membrane protein OmpA-like peptidoglycan-associated protein